MPVRYLLDTNTASYVIKGNIPQVRERLVKVPMAEIGVSVITEAELRFGVARRPDVPHLKLAVDEFLLRLAMLAWDSGCAKNYAEIRADLDKQGKPMGNLDMMIAAQALAAEAVLVTHDRVFWTVKQLEVEDWTKPR